MYNTRMTNNNKTNKCWDAYYISENERWISGWRGYYSATKDGHVKCYKHVDVRYVTPHYSTGGRGDGQTEWGIVHFEVGSRVEWRAISRVIFETFIRPLADNEVVVCKNGNRKDMRVENLVAKTQREVMCDPARLAKDRAKKYTEVLLEREDGMIYCFNGYTNAMDECGISGSRLRQLIRNAEKAGLDYFVCRGMKYKFIVVRAARYANADPNNMRKAAK